MRSISRVGGVATLTLALLLAFGTAAQALPLNKCLSKKHDCVIKKAQGLLNCHGKAEKKGELLDQECVAKVEKKFAGTPECDGGSNNGATCALASECPGGTCDLDHKGCFDKLEDKSVCDGGPNDGNTCAADSECPGGLCPKACFTFADTFTMEAKIDAFVLDVVEELDPNFPNRCAGGGNNGNVCIAASECPGGTCPPTFSQCSSKKKKCVTNKTKGKLKCWSKAYKSGLPSVDAACLTKVNDKFDGKVKCFGGSNNGALCSSGSECPGGVCQNDGKGCFAKLESKYPPTDVDPAPNGPCLTINDTQALEAKVDAFINDVLCELNAAPPVGACPTSVQADAIGFGIDLDPGWTGQSHDQGAPELGRLTLAISGCSTGPNHPCGTCNVSGPIQNAGGTTYNTQRCTGNTSVQCTTNGDCTATRCLTGSNASAACTVASECPGGTCGPAGGICRFHFGGPLPLSAGGVSVCVVNEVSAAVTGTANPDTGESSASVPLVSHVFTGPTQDKPCPNCLFDGVSKTYKCDSGPRVGQLCTINGVSPLFGQVSLDCPPNPGGNIANLDIPTVYQTGFQTKSLTAASPPCTAPGFGTRKCFCGTCNSGPTVVACDEDTDCPDPPGPIGPICNGLRCAGGGNVGAACTVASECPGSGCVRDPANAKSSKPNECDNSLCWPNTPPDNDSIDEGVCAAGPFELFCAVQSYRSCNTNGDCTSPDFPGDTCTDGRFRNCFPDNGVIGKHCFSDINGSNAEEPCTTLADCPDQNPSTSFCAGGSVSLAGAAYPACGVTNSGRGKTASFFCIAPTTSVSVNNVSGLPGLGRVTIPAIYTFN